MDSERLYFKNFLDCKQEKILILLNQYVFIFLTCKSCFLAATYAPYLWGREGKADASLRGGGSDLAEPLSHRKVKWKADIYRADCSFLQGRPQGPCHSKSKPCS